MDKRLDADRTTAARQRDAGEAIRIIVEIVIDSRHELLDAEKLDLVVEVEAYISRNADRLSPAVTENIRKLAALMQSSLAVNDHNR